MTEDAELLDRLRSLDEEEVGERDVDIEERARGPQEEGGDNAATATIKMEATLELEVIRADGTREYYTADETHFDPAVIRQLMASQDDAE